MNELEKSVKLFEHYADLHNLYVTVLKKRKRPSVQKINNRTYIILAKGPPRYKRYARDVIFMLRPIHEQG
jgi:hypothetical protein